jgi:hypothetical protein
MLYNIVSGYSVLRYISIVEHRFVDLQNSNIYLTLNIPSWYISSFLMLSFDSLILIDCSAKSPLAERTNSFELDLKCT